MTDLPILSDGFADATEAAAIMPLPIMCPALVGPIITVKLDRCICYPLCATKVPVDGNGICDWHRKQLAE